jgi:lysophospholipase L1-like esterase
MHGPGDSDYPGTFKHNMQQIIDAVQGAGKVALVAKVPIRYGDCSGKAKCHSYVQSGITPESASANNHVRDYNRVIDELIEENGLVLKPDTVPLAPLVAPDFYSYFNGSGLDGQGKSPLYFDWLHPNGRGYRDMADLWLQSLVPSRAHERGLR